MQRNAFCKGSDLKNEKQFGGSSVMTYSLKGKKKLFPSSSGFRTNIKGVYQKLRC